MRRAVGKSVRRLHDRAAEPVRERGCENRAPGGGGGASQGANSGRDVGSRKDHGRSLWPTAKRFSSPRWNTQAIPVQSIVSLVISRWYDTRLRPLPWSSRDKRFR